MFDVGFQELVLLFVIGLLVLGPQKLPKVAAEIGKWVGRARRTATQLRRQLEREIELSEIQPPKPPPPPACAAAGPAAARAAARGRAADSGAASRGRRFRARSAGRFCAGRAKPRERARRG